MYAEMVLMNGMVRPLDGSQRSTSGLAIVWDRIAVLDNDDALAEYIGPATQVIDLRGRTVLPGFNDAHCHVFIYGQSKLLWRNLRPEVVDDLEDVLHIVGEEATRLPPGHWIRGRGFDPAALPPDYGVTRHDLDQVAPHHPVCLTRLGGHVIVGNSRALETAGVTSNTPDPAGGKIDRDRSGEPTGVLREAAQRLLYDVIPPPSLDEAKRCIRAATEDYLAGGITSVQNAGTVKLDMEAFQCLHRARDLPVRVYLMIKEELLDSLIGAGLQTGFGDEFLRIGPLKIFLDGGIGAQTAAISEPYVGEEQNRGILWLEQEQLDRQVERAHRAGLQVAIHAIGDRAISSALTAYRRALAAKPSSNHRHRIEHCELATADLLEQIVELKILAVPQPIFLAEMGHTYVENLGPERAHRLFPLRNLLNAGVPLAGSSDSPVSSFRPLEGVQAAVMRGKSSSGVIGPGQRISVAEALKIYTSGGAYASFEETQKGSLVPGRLADLVVLDHDPFHVPPEELSTIEVDMTIVGGKVMYRRD